MAEFDLSMPEAWYPIPGFPGYEISSHYRIGSYWSNFGITKKVRKIKAVKVYDRRPMVTLRVAGADGRPLNRPFQLGTFVALVALGPCPAGKMVLHRDDDPTNNHPSNLYYGDKRQNMEDAIRNRRWKPTRGAEKWSARLDDEDIAAIRCLARRGVPQWIIASLFDVHQSHVCKIASGRKWAHVPLSADGKG